MDVGSRCERLPRGKHVYEREADLEVRGPTITKMRLSTAVRRKRIEGTLTWTNLLALGGLHNAVWILPRLLRRERDGDVLIFKLGTRILSAGHGHPPRCPIRAGEKVKDRRTSGENARG